MRARRTQPRHIVEFGTSCGIATLYPGAALRDSGGHLITTECAPSTVARAPRNRTEAGSIDLVELRQGDARRLARAMR